MRLKRGLMPIFEKLFLLTQSNDFIGCHLGMDGLERGFIDQLKGKKLNAWFYIYQITYSFSIHRRKYKKENCTANNKFLFSFYVLFTL